MAERIYFVGFSLFVFVSLAGCSPAEVAEPIERRNEPQPMTEIDLDEDSECSLPKTRPPESGQSLPDTEPQFHFDAHAISQYAELAIEERRLLPSNVIFVSFGPEAPKAKLLGSDDGWNRWSSHGKASVENQQGELDWFEYVVVLREKNLETVAESIVINGRTVYREQAKEADSLAFRTWTSANGKFTTEAALKWYANGEAMLEKKDGTTKKVKINDLSDADQKFIKNKLR